MQISAELCHLPVTPVLAFIQLSLRQRTVTAKQSDLVPSTLRG
jgi:hypothetical protein